LITDVELLLVKGVSCWSTVQALSGFCCCPEISAQRD
jgi:hypothetical protein